MGTATDPRGIVHQLNGNMTLCGQDATGWSRLVTDAQRIGLVIFCDPCHGQPVRVSIEEI